MLEKDAILSKISIIKRCLETVKKVTGLDPGSLDEIIAQDVFVLNLQRSIQACIDIANILIAQNGWNLPASYREAFLILSEKKVTNEEMSKFMMKMCGFRNIAVHDYRQITPAIMKTILTHHIKDFEEFYTAIYTYMDKLL
jgi:uncharacterized protein YutE (UPF0331/DUF86 family)